MTWFYLHCVAAIVIVIADAKASQNAEIPADIRQNEKIEVLEREVERLRSGKRN